jgi:hypothetical protein
MSVQSRCQDGLRRLKELQALKTQTEKVSPDTLAELNNLSGISEDISRDTKCAAQNVVTAKGNMMKQHQRLQAFKDGTAKLFIADMENSDSGHQIEERISLEIPNTLDLLDCFQKEWLLARLSQDSDCTLRHLMRLQLLPAPGAGTIDLSEQHKLAAECTRVLRLKNIENSSILQAEFVTDKTFLQSVSFMKTLLKDTAFALRLDVHNLKVIGIHKSSCVNLKQQDTFLRPQLRVVFCRFDINSDGMLDEEEFENLLLALDPQGGQKVNFGSIDTDNSGSIDFEEFSRWLLEE